MSNSTFCKLALKLRNVWTQIKSHSLHMTGEVVLRWLMRLRIASLNVIASSAGGFRSTNPLNKKRDVSSCLFVLRCHAFLSSKVSISFFSGDNQLEPDLYIQLGVCLLMSFRLPGFSGSRWRPALPMPGASSTCELISTGETGDTFSKVEKTDLKK